MAELLKTPLGFGVLVAIGVIAFIQMTLLNAIGDIFGTLLQVGLALYAGWSLRGKWEKMKLENGGR